MSSKKAVEAVVLSERIQQLMWNATQNTGAKAAQYLEDAGELQAELDNLIKNDTEDELVIPLAVLETNNSNPKLQGDGTTLASSNEVISWLDSDASVGTRYYLYINGAAKSPTTAKSIQISNLPDDGSTLNVELRKSDGVTVIDSISVIAYAEDAAPSVTLSPVSGATLTSSSQTFTVQNLPANNVWGIWVGSTIDDDNYFNSGPQTLNATITATGLPTDGSNVLVRIAYKANSTSGSQFVYLNYTAHTNVTTPVTPAGSMNWPALGSSFPSLVSASSFDGNGESTQFSYGGKTIAVANFSNGERLPYSKTHGVGPLGYPTATSCIVKDNNSLCYRSDTGASLGGAGFSSVSRVSLTHASRVYGFSGSNLQYHDFATGNKTTVKEFSGSGLSGSLNFGQAEGNFTQDDSKVLVNDSSNNYASLDVGTGNIVVRSQSQLFALANQAYGETPNEIDWVGFSLGGKIIANMDGFSGNTDKRFTMMNPDFSNPTKLGDPITRARHASFFRGVNGEDCIIIYHWDSVIIVDLDDPTKVYRILTPTGGTSNHQCGTLSIGQPGWTLHSTTGPDARLMMIRFDKADFAGASVSADDFNYLGNHFLPTSSVDMRVVATIPHAYGSSTGSYPNSGMPQAMHDGSAIFGSSGSNGSSEVISKITVS